MRKLILSVVISIMHFSNSYSQGAVSTIGQAHNTALETYYKKYGDGEPIDIVTVTKRLYQINKQSDPIHFEAFTESDLEKLTTEIFGTNNINNFNFRDRGKFLLNNFATSGQISNDLLNLMLAFIDDHPSKDLMVSKVDSFLERAKTSEKERKLVEDFKAVFLYSNEFWSSRDTRNGSDLNYRSRCNPGDQRSFADAFGGLIGAVLGSSFPPFGSAVGGFVGSQGMSAIIRAIQNHHGGGCI